ncbi:hypothetical protein JCM4814A_49240 [Streptomyces phaeofaciens JCM 4814]|uniref:Uncharacterized protein n=1 Tax=Streptomyces phaeofaciens TaxID=68254 RepID=A0A918H1U0_9ACTN|nr:hypothetical protein GCM10010226_05900 [Streptomyces phaeofaciens]
MATGGGESPRSWHPGPVLDGLRGVEDEVLLAGGAQSAIRPTVERTPTTPQQAAGKRMDPPMSLPGPAQTVLTAPEDPYTRRLRDSVPRPGWKPTRHTAQNGHLA